MGFGELLGSFKDEFINKAKKIDYERKKAATMSDREILDRLKYASGDEKIVLLSEYKKRQNS